ncbi:MAG: neocarzinostatin apoprotein domain-containing protein [Pseudomonadota bacterium]
MNHSDKHCDLAGASACCRLFDALLDASKRVSACFSALSLALILGCSDGSDGGTTTAVVGPLEFAVGTTSRTYVDGSRTTDAHANVPEAATRTLDTLILYPAEGSFGDPVATDAPVDRWGAPYPLVVLAHGLGGNAQGLLALGEVWASRGYVVVLPQFPLTNSATPGGPVGQDTQNQPGDVSFLIDEVLAESSQSGQLFSDVVNGDQIAVSGHSNGGITTFGLIAHSCCKDSRLDAAIVLSGVNSPFAGGEYNLSDTPPTFVVHGVFDLPLAYNQAVRTYNELSPIKGLLTLEQADHTSYLGADDVSFDASAQATADFLDAQIRGDTDALERLPTYVIPELASISWVPDDAANRPVEPLPEPETNRQASLSEDSNLVDGQTIVVSWSGFLPDTVVSILQCAGDGRDQASCNIAGGRVLVPDPLGMGSLDLVIRTGAIGNGVCDSANPCTIVVNDASLIEDEANVRIPITFRDD